jgi:hypothetical protein
MECREKFRFLQGPERENMVKRMRYLRRRIRELMGNRGYRFKKAGSIGTGAVLESKRCGTVITDSFKLRGRYGKPFYYKFSRALTKEEHEELMRKKNENK